MSSSSVLSLAGEIQSCCGELDMGLKEAVVKLSLRVLPAFQSDSPSCGQIQDARLALDEVMRMLPSLLPPSMYSRLLCSLGEVSEGLGSLHGMA